MNHTQPIVALIRPKRIQCTIAYANCLPDTLLITLEHGWMLYIYQRKNHTLNLYKVLVPDTFYSGCTCGCNVNCQWEMNECAHSPRTETSDSCSVYWYARCTLCKQCSLFTLLVDDGWSNSLPSGPVQQKCVCLGDALQQCLHKGNFHQIFSQYFDQKNALWSCKPIAEWEFLNQTSTTSSSIVAYKEGHNYFC